MPPPDKAANSSPLQLLNDLEKELKGIGKGGVSNGNREKWVATIIAIKASLKSTTAQPSTSSPVLSNATSPLIDLAKTPPENHAKACHEAICSKEVQTVTINRVFLMGICKLALEHSSQATTTNSDSPRMARMEELLLSISQDNESIKKDIESLKRGHSKAGNRAPDSLKQIETILIKPKAGGPTLAEIIKRKVPSTSIVRSTTSAKGHHVIKTTSNKDFDKIQSTVGNDGTVSRGAKFHPQVKVFAVEAEITESEIVDCLGGKEEARVLRSFKIKPREGETSDKKTWLVELKSKAYRNVMENQTVCPRLGHCYRCDESDEIHRCTHCQGLGHSKTKCPESGETATCGKCAGEHETNQCTSNEPKCANCTRENLKSEVAKPTNHTASDRKCPAAVRFLNFRLNNTQY